MGGGDDVTLTEREQQELAALAAGIDDPWLAHQLGGVGAAPGSRRPRNGLAVILGGLHRWLGVPVLLAGAALTVLTFTRWLWVAVAGLAVMAAGGLVTWQHHGGRVGALLSDRGTPATPSPGTLSEA